MSNVPAQDFVILNHNDNTVNRKATMETVLCQKNRNDQMIALFHTKYKHWIKICDTGAQNPSLVVFGFFYSIVFYTASASKYFLHNQNILFVTEVILV